jgi:RNA polymerase sigma factor (sigma-70 family)
VPGTTTAMTDHELLVQYARSGSQAAFAALVGRHAPWVYAAAVRMLRGDRHLAEDVAQAVFIVLSRKSSALVASRAALGPWLLSVTRYTAATALRAASRRANHERRAAQARPEAVGGAEADGGEEASWRWLEPLLDRLVDRLAATDRRAVVLRFYEQKTFAQLAAELGSTEEAARKRVARAIDRLRAMIERAGVTVAAAALATSMAQHTSAAAADPVIAGVISRAVEAAGSTAGAVVISAPTAAQALAKGAMTMMTLAKLKVAAGLVAAVCLTGAGAWAAASGWGSGATPADPGGDIVANSSPSPAALAANDKAPKVDDAFLGRVVPELHFTDVALDDCVSFLNDVGRSTLEVDWAAFEAAGVKKLAIVKLDVKGATYREAITKVFRAAGAKSNPVIGAKAGKNGERVVTVGPGKK